MKFKIFKCILIQIFIFILLFQSCSLIVYASTENILENQIEEEKSNSVEVENKDSKNELQQDIQEEEKDKPSQNIQEEEKNELSQDIQEKDEPHKNIQNKDTENISNKQNSLEQKEIENELKVEAKSILPISLSNPKTITSKDFFKESILDSLDLNLINMPTVTVENKGSHIWTEVVGTHPKNPESKYQHKMLYFTSKLYNQNLDEIITVIFNNAGTLDGKPIDIKFVYSDLHTTSNVNETRDFFLSWCPYGKVETRTTFDEFFNIGFDRFNLDITFYYHGEKNPIILDNAYFTVSSLDKEENHIEATNSLEASNVYYYENTAIKRSSQEIVGGKTYTNVFEGTVSDYDSRETRSAVCFEYNNKRSINFNMFSLGTEPISFGYHVNFYPLNAAISNPIKSVNKLEAYPSDTLVYTVKQKMPYINNDHFEFNSFEFKDKLATCFDFNSINLEVKDYNGNNITSSCRKYKNSKWRGNL